MSRMRTLFRVGPIVMLIPTLLWATAWNLLLHDENQSWYIVWPLIGFIGIAVIWHVALLVIEKNRLAYLGYALVHLPAFFVIYVFSIIFATHFPI
jgi:hypothetical protein